MFKTIFAAAVAVTSLAVIAIPAQAATTAGYACDTGASIVGSEDMITAELTAQGYAVTGVEEWNNCVRAFVVKADGSQGMALFQPGSLELVSEV